MAKAREYRQDDYVPFYSAGMRVRGQYRCSDCGYGVTIHDELPRCPMCTGTTWEAVPSRPLGRRLGGEVGARL